MLSKVFVKRHLLYFKSLVYVTLLALMDGIWLPVQIYHHLRVKRLEDPSQGILYSQTSTWLAYCNFTGLQIYLKLLLYLAFFLEVKLGCIYQFLLQISGMEQTSFLFQQASKVIVNIVTLMVMFKMCVLFLLFWTFLLIFCEIFVRVPYFSLV